MATAPKKAPVAGSPVEPAVTGTAPGAESKEVSTEAAPAAPVIVPELPPVAPAEVVVAAAAPAVEAIQAAPAILVAQFPRSISIVNETPMNFIVATAFIPPGEAVSVTVRNQDEITRIKTDCTHLMELTPALSALDPQPLRVVDDAE